MAERMPGATRGGPLSPISTLIARSQVKYQGFARRLGSDTIAYSISEAAFTIQFGSYQPPPIPYLDFAPLSRNRRSLYPPSLLRKRKELGYNSGAERSGEGERAINMVNLIARGTEKSFTILYQVEILPNSSFWRS